MTDTVSKTKRSYIMSRVKSAGTAPELILATLLNKMKISYTQNDNRLPGKPDFVLWKDKIAIFVNGCFWHSHKGCSKSNLPSTNRKYWKDKITSNKTRDLHSKRKLRILGWRSITIWECELRKLNSLINKIDIIIR